MTARVTIDPDASRQTSSNESNGDLRGGFGMGFGMGEVGDIGVFEGALSRQTWVEDSDRPGGIGRAERERVFWERVAMGRTSVRRNASPRPDAASRENSPRFPDGHPQRDAPAPRTSPDENPARGEAPWESVRIAIVTLLTVVVFGLGWTTIELEGTAGYDRGLSEALTPAPWPDRAASRGEPLDDTPDDTAKYTLGHSLGYLSGLASNDSSGNTSRDASREASGHALDSVPDDGLPIE